MMLHRRTYLPLLPENITGARQARTQPLVSAFLLTLLLCGCSQLGVYTEASCTEANGAWVVSRVRPVYTCQNFSRNSIIISKTPCDWQVVRKCTLPREQEQIAKQEAFRKTDLYSILTEQD